MHLKQELHDINVQHTYVNTLPASSIMLCEIATLTHKSRNDTMKTTSLEVKYFPRSTNAFLPCAEATKILRRSRHNIGTQFHLYPAL